MTDQELLKALERYPAGDPVTLYHVDVTGGYVEAVSSGRPVTLRPGEFWLTTNVEARKDFRGGRGLQGNIVAFQLDNRFVSLLEDLAMDQRGGAATEKFMKELFNVDLAVPRVNFEGGGKGVKLPKGDYNIALRVTTNAPEFNRLFQLSTERMDRVRYDETQPVGSRLVPFGKVGALGVVTPGEPGSGMRDHEATQTAALGFALAAGVIVRWLDDYCIERDMKKDVKEWEDYILTRQGLDPEQGFLLVAILKVWQPRDAVYETRSYVSMEMVEDYTLWNAEARAAKSILPGLPPPTDTVWYTYRKIWIAPLQPRPTLTADQKDEKLYGRKPWYPRYQLVRHSLEEPADYGEALGVLQGSSMFDILRVLDALPPSQYNALKGQLYVVKEAANRSRFRIAFAAVEDNKSSSSFGSWQFLPAHAGDYAALGNDFERNCVKDWVDSGEGAISNTLQGRWEVIWNGINFEYSFYLSGKAIWRDRNNLGAIGGAGTWNITTDAVRVQWPQTGTVEKFNLPLDLNKETAITQTKSGTFPMTARKINPYP
ncbi:MAG TPA: hypothetical protein VK812_12860 [Candidatus Binatus sp.]|jgi:hypothetical protein|nr:hypothetical protein [Candidatus Binatus sp.]